MGANPASMPETCTPAYVLVVCRSACGLIFLAGTAVLGNINERCGRRLCAVYRSGVHAVQAAQEQVYDLS